MRPTSLEPMTESKVMRAAEARYPGMSIRVQPTPNVVNPTHYQVQIRPAGIDKNAPLGQAEWKTVVVDTLQGCYNWLAAGR